MDDFQEENLTPDEQAEKDSQEAGFNDSHRSQDTSTFDQSEQAEGQKGGEVSRPAPDIDYSSVVTRQEYGDSGYGDIPLDQAEDIDSMTPEESAE